VPGRDAVAPHLNTASISPVPAGDPLSGLSAQGENPPPQTPLQGEDLNLDQGKNRLQNQEENHSPQDTFDVTVHNVPVRDLLFVLAREARLDLDIHPEIRGEISLNAVRQPLSRIFSRIARQASVRFEREGAHYVALPDTPFLAHYQIDYVNLNRFTSGAVATNTQIATQTNNATGAGSPLGSGNVSSTRVENVSRNQFWESLEMNIQDLLDETGAEVVQSGSGPRPLRHRASVVVHPETGMMTVRATAHQHARVREFIRRVENAARRQVMIETTIVEVELGDDYQQGIEWSRVWAEGAKTLNVKPPAAVSGTPAAITPFVLEFANQANPLTATLNLLKSFGAMKVLSSPRLSVLNNQTALLKVVENVVYFSIKAEITPGNANANPLVAYTTTPQTVSVGLVMTVTPQISEKDSVILNVRPTISSISGMVKDPNPDIPSSLSNEIPQIRTREIESILRVESGEIAVLGGLMEDRIDSRTGKVPFLGEIPFAGELLTIRNNAVRKSELVIFLRPVVIHDPGLDGDFASMKAHLPGDDYFQSTSPLDPMPLSFPPKLP
jgi:general secretion pathway protein D